jgi:transcriptional regulator with XRE-family HTH domain
MGALSSPYGRILERQLLSYSEPDLLGVGARLTEFRLALGLTQEQAAKKYGVGLRSWNRFEGGHRRPNSDLLALLAGDGLNANWLMTGDGPMLGGVSGTDDLTREEASILAMIRALPASKRADVKIVINAFVSAERQKDKTG